MYVTGEHHLGNTWYFIGWNCIYCMPQVLQEIVSCGWTVLMVAHDLKTVEEAHHIIYMERGTVVEEGTHEQLMAKRGRYYRLKMFSE